MRLIRPGPPDPKSGPDARLRWIASSHEAAHAIAAYHLRFPIVHVRFQEPRNGQIADTHVESDNAAYQIAQRFLTGIGATNQRMLVAFCAVMTIARWTNIQVNHIHVDEAKAYSRSDYRQMADYLARLSLDPLQQTTFVEKGEIEAKRIIALPGYRDALDAISSRLIQALEIRDFEVARLTEQKVGHWLRLKVRDPHHDEVSLAAYYHHLDQIRNGQASDSLEDWLVAERGIRFGIASFT